MELTTADKFEAIWMALEYWLALQGESEVSAKDVLNLMKSMETKIKEKV